jgi:dienelactone hydrolase
MKTNLLHSRTPFVHFRARLILASLFLPLLFACSSLAASSPPRVLPPGQLPSDHRLRPLKDLDGYFPFEPPDSREAWARRAEYVRRQVLVSQGLWPMPERTPLNPVIHGRQDLGDYTVEKVYLESFPGFYVTGNLYRPKNRQGRLPAVLTPHGHWPNGRFYDEGPDRVRRHIVEGAERFEEGGRSPLQARCVQLAKMGLVVFHYDMLGYADSQQISYDLAHRFAKQRPEMNSEQNWGLYSPQAESHLQNVMGLHTWNSIRALDFLAELPDVDPARIVVTGASGGGTQTFILCAVDARPAISFPAVMVSTAMQGGCTCENTALLRVGTGNIELAGLFAPKPQGVTSADDWTREMATKGFPELKKLYTLLGAPDNVLLKRGEHFGHNFNYVSRAALYSWINKHFNLGLKEPIVEDDYKRLSVAEMTVWNDQHPKPEDGPDFERKLLRYWTTDTEKQLAAARSSLSSYKEIAGPALDVIIGRRLEQAGEVEFNLVHKHDRGAYIEMSGLLQNTTYKEELPALFLHPKEWNGHTVVWLSEAGKAGLYEGGKLRPEIQKLLNSGATVAGLDLLFQGEFLPDGKPHTQTRRVKNPREAAGYTFGYNHALFAQRVHDLLSAVQYIRQHERKSKSITLAGLDGTGPLAAAARVQSGDAVTTAVVNTRGFRFAKVTDLHDPQFLPGGAKYDDLPGMLGLSAPGKTWLAGESDPALVAALYRSAAAENSLTVYRGAQQETSGTAVAWLIQGF